MDGDHLLFVATAACERDVRWDVDNHVLFSNREEAYALFKTRLDKIVERLKGTRVFLAFTGSDNFRRKISSGYKAGRPRKPLCYWDLFQQISEDYTVRRYEQLEADDVMGIWQTSGKFKDSIIVSDDKDLMTIPGRIYRQGAIVHVDEPQANLNWMVQTLVGDVTDGYPGCPGVGAVTAARLLDDGTLDLATLWGTVVATFEGKGLTAEGALMQARLARILRASDWDSEKQEVKLWTP
jgi:DNA polymerase-1